MHIPLYYEFPLFFFIIFAVYTIHSMFVARRLLREGNLRVPYFWFILSAISFLLWGIEHVYHDLYPLPVETAIFFHYVISHGFLLISMFCIAVAAYKTKKVFKNITK